MPNTVGEKAFILCLRLLMAWTFLYPGIHQVLAPNFNVAGFLSHTKTFHGFFAVFTTPVMAQLTSALVGYGHLLIGLSLLMGVAVRLGASLGALLMVLYWMAHMDWPYIENQTNFIIDQHLVYAGLLLWLAAVRAGRIWGVDAWAEQKRFIRDSPPLRALLS